MQINIFTSKDNQEVVSRLTRKLPGGTRENVIARIAICYSLSTKKRFTQEEFSTYDSSGKEYKDSILFDPQYRDIYISLVCQAYRISPDDECISKYIKLHLDHGLELIDNYFNDNPDMAFLDFFMKYLTKGVEALDNIVVTLDPAVNSNLKVNKNSFSGPIEIKIGYNKTTKEEIRFCFNDTRKYNNQHIAVAGMSGSGKTQVAKEFMWQLNDITKGKVNFLFLDFKGLKEEERKKEEDFFRSANVHYVDAPHSPFPLNPLTFIDKSDDKNKIVGINKFVDIIARYAGLGNKQKQFLKDATAASFDNVEGDAYPGMNDVYSQLLELVGDKRDSLTEIMQHLSEYELFDNSISDPSEFLNNNYYFSLSGELDNTVRFTAIVLIIYYIFNVFTNMGSAPVENGYQSMRYVLMIDEAHDLFREKKTLEILETILRKIRSYGVSVFLLSQGIKEYDQGTFDFSQECSTAFLLPINDKKNTKAINKFLGLSEKESIKAIRNLEELESGSGYAISNMKEFPRAEIFSIVKYWSENQKRSK